MLNKFFALIFISSAASVSGVAQQMPVPNDARAPRVFLQSISEGGYLGIQTQEVTKENFARFGLREVRGVAVEKVSENSPAAQAGLLANDVIVRVNNEEISGARKLTRLISETAPDHQVRLTILRGGSEREITATLGKRDLSKLGGNNFNFESFPSFPDFPREPLAPNAPFSGLAPNAIVTRIPTGRQIGVGVSELTKQLGEYFGVAAGKGLLINNVRENSPAAKAGLKAGDVIVEIDGKPIGESAEMIRALNEKKDGDVSLTIVRDRNRQTMRVTPEASKGEILNFNEQFERFPGNGEPLRLDSQMPLMRIAPPRRMPLDADIL